ncbi:hypothetical protein BpHYR1_048277 [Brachionus plicatilis]|uniref:Uncharacterized protein n=1 Tax=Brachionus plicatilis TaxID=10195 RepID=A0A3M7QDG9_BRAPC|nr:hypothetical protein BpHYR1_048277 [Brachionus plicatilis]
MAPIKKINSAKCNGACLKSIQILINNEKDYTRAFVKLKSEEKLNDYANLNTQNEILNLIDEDERLDDKLLNDSVDSYFTNVENISKSKEVNERRSEELSVSNEVKPTEIKSRVSKATNNTKNIKKNNK